MTSWPSWACNRSIVAPILQLAGVSKNFGGVRALQDVDFELHRGEVHCLAGENGCGKSTLIKIITGVHAPEPGAEITFAGDRRVGSNSLTLFGVWSQSVSIRNMS